ncbi:hypothetical protein Pcinc_012760 [Petrolisthes cinctipes]|uniref:non-specific serine/threonine protein kinase n=1 Tax=Petrolisthes cinctipes TaxID=88211 RepID=A0AAE1KR34_PETCI|nr:hypothetical protein Pcinc_012760 [Petrolisthes cinctipes]
MARDDTMQDMFIEEGLILYHLQGVGGAPRLLGLSLKTPLILMSVCQGSQLDDIKPDLSLIDTSSWWLAIFTSVVNNVMELHSAGCIHNDIKSDNVIVNTSNKTSIIDYGIARMGNRPTMPFIADNLPTVEEVDEYQDKYQRYAPELYFKGISSAASDVYGVGKMFQDIFCEHKDTGLDTLWQEGLGNLVESMTCSKASQRLSLTQVSQELSCLCQRQSLQPSGPQRQRRDTVLFVQHSPQSERTHHQSSQSETTHHQSSQSETTHQQSSQSETTHKQSSQSETTHQQSSQSETTHHQSSQSETTHHQSSQIETTHQQSSQSETTHKQSSQSETTHQQSPQSETTHHQSSQIETTHVMSTHQQSPQRKVPLQRCRSLYQIVTAWAKRKNNKL